MRFFIRLFINAAALMAISYTIDGISIEGPYAAIIAAIILGLVNAVLRPLVLLLSLPVTILTLGLFTLVVNAFLFWFVSTIVKGFEVSGFVSAFVGALIVSIVSFATGVWFRKEERRMN